MNDWVQQAEYKSEVIIDIGFMVQESFYFGPENGFTPEQYQELREALPVPDFEMSGNFVLTKNLAGKEFLLAEHYKAVVAMHEKHCKDISKSTHFWNRPIVFQENDFCISFSWHDRFREGKNVLESLSSIQDGEIYWDRDQGWELEIYGQGEFLFAREWDPDYEKLHCQVKFDRKSVREQSQALIAHTTEIISYLSREIGHDHWT